MFTCDIGSCLHKVTHLYSYSSFDERDEIRSKCIKDPRFQQYVQLARPHVQYQENRVMKEVGLYEWVMAYIEEILTWILPISIHLHGLAI